MQPICCFPHTQKDLDRFWKRILKTDTCWLWTGALFKNGYGAFTFLNKTIRAHRFSWSVAHSQPIPDGLVIMHTCDNPGCVRPDHLQLGTVDENNKDRMRKGRGMKGEVSPKAKLTEDQIRSIRADNRGYRTIAKEYGVARTLIQAIIKRKIWTHVE